MQRPTLVSAQPGLGLSSTLWDNFPVDEILVMRDRNYGFGFYDDFDNWESYVVGTGATLASPWATEVAASGTVAQVAETLQGEFGVLDVHCNGTNSSEVTIQRGATLGCPYVLSNFDLCFEARLRFSAITASKFAWFLGLAMSDSTTAAHCLTTATSPVPYSSDDFIGFWGKSSLVPAVSAMYQNGTGNYTNGTYSSGLLQLQTGSASGLVDGTVNTNLAAVATLVASAGSATAPTVPNTYVPSWINLGFRYYASPGILKWFVNGTEFTAARLGPAILGNLAPFSASGTSYTFPNATFLNPTFCIKQQSNTTTACDVYLDFMACAQLSPSATTTTADTAPP